MVKCLKLSEIQTWELMEPFLIAFPAVIWGCYTLEVVPRSSNSSGTLPCIENQRAVRNGNENATAIAEHASGYQHRIDWEAAEVVDYP